MSVPIILLCLSALFSFSGIASDKHSIIKYRLVDYGAIPGDDKDDSNAFNTILEIIQKEKGNYIIELPSGTIDIHKRIIANKLKGIVKFKGTKGTVFLIKSEGFAHLSAEMLEIKGMQDSLSRGDKKVQFSSDIHFLEKGDLIHIQSSTPYETGWNYKENDIQRIEDITTSTLYLKDRLIFNYNTKKEDVKCSAYRFCKIEFLDIEFRLLRNNLNDEAHAIVSLAGISLVANNVSMSYNGNTSLSRHYMGFSISASEGLTFSNLKLENLQYGVLMNYCRNIYANKTLARLSRHAYAPATCENIFIENIKGVYCNSVIDAHQSFNVHYKNVTDTLALEYPNCRAMGTLIENARFYLKDTSYYQDYCYWSIQLFTSEYAFLYNEYDTRFNNVYWVVSKPSGLNGLTSFMCRNFIIKNSTTHNIAYYGSQKSVKSIIIENCEVGMIRIDAQKTKIINTILDGNLYKKAPYIFRFTGAGITSLEDVVIKNYNSKETYMFGDFYNESTINSLLFKNVKLNTPLKGWTNRFIYPGLNYTSCKFDNASEIKLTEALPVELNALKGKVRVGK